MFRWNIGLKNIYFNVKSMWRIFCKGSYTNLKHTWWLVQKYSLDGREKGQIREENDGGVGADEESWKERLEHTAERMNWL